MVYTRLWWECQVILCHNVTMCSLSWPCTQFYCQGWSCRVHDLQRSALSYQNKAQHTVHWLKVCAAWIFNSFNMWTWRTCRTRSRTKRTQSTWTDLLTTKLCNDSSNWTLLQELLLTPLVRSHDDTTQMSIKKLATSKFLLRVITLKTVPVIPVQCKAYPSWTVGFLCKIVRYVMIWGFTNKIKIELNCANMSLASYSFNTSLKNVFKWNLWFFLPQTGWSPHWSPLLKMDYYCGSSCYL